jgi:hypothetical protein
LPQVVSFTKSKRRESAVTFLIRFSQILIRLPSMEAIHRKIFGFYRLLARRFPYAVYYKMDLDGSLIVHRVLDCRQDPAKIRRALKSSE